MVFINICPKIGFDLYVRTYTYAYISLRIYVYPQWYISKGARIEEGDLLKL